MDIKAAIAADGSNVKEVHFHTPLYKSRYRGRRELT